MNVWLDNGIQIVVTLGGLALAGTAIGAAWVALRRTRPGRAIALAWSRAFVVPHDERRAHVIRRIILPDLDAVRQDTRKIADQLRVEVRDLIEQHTIEEQRQIERQTERIRAVQASADSAVRISSESLRLARTRDQRIAALTDAIGHAEPTTDER